MPTPGPLELVIILVIALLILGPGKLPDVGAALGKSIREFRKASSDVQDAVKVDTSPLPAQPPTTAASAAAAPVATMAPSPAAEPAPEPVGPAPEPAVAATAAELPGAPTAASVTSTEPTPGTN
jgi:TatA/E family protein of Tat protein translocase